MTRSLRPDVVEPPVVGQYRLVPAVYAKDFYSHDDWIPVIGPKHTDAEHVKFPWPHFHIDWRFAPTWLFRRCVSKWTRGGTLLTTGAYYATPIMCPNNFGERVIFEGPVLRRMKCKRELDPYPREHAKWLEGLAKDLHTRGCGRLINGTCPHRGIPVDAMHRDGDVLTCPAHGLRFSASTGEMLDGSSPEALR